MTSAQNNNDVTGRYLVLLEEDAAVAGAREVSRVSGLRLVSTADSAGASATEMFRAADGLVLHDLGVAVVSAEAEQAGRLTVAAGTSGPIATVEAERVVHAIAAPAAEPAAPGVDETACTWGLQVVGAQQCTASGAGVRVAVLDTGVDLRHPDLAGRNVVSSSFVEGESVQDGHGHGTHCVGTSLGAREPENGPAYGVAHRADIYVGKVLSDSGSGADGGILAGIQWAVANGCAVVSMSLGATVRPGTPYSQVFERVAKRALDRGTLIIAAAGNDSDRASGQIAPVGHPANCPSILAVGAVDVHGAVADFSCGTVDNIGQVDVVGPGVDVYSIWPMPARTRRISGTSMATPHVAGVAALIAERYCARDWELWARLVQTARRLNLPANDVGAGLVQAP